MAPIRRGRFASAAGTVTLSPLAMSYSLKAVSSRRFEQAVLADLFVGKFPHHRAALEHDDAVGERQHVPGSVESTMMASPLRAGP